MSSTAAVTARVRFELGFRGGPTLAGRVSRDALESLRAAIERGEPWHELEDDDGAVLVSLGQVAYLRTDREEQRLGFG